MNRRNVAGSLVIAPIIVLGCGSALAQGRRVSPHERTPTVTVAGSEMFIEYGRPSMRGRKIFGWLIRYDEVWCPGADEATYLSTSKNLIIGDFLLPAGEYSLWILPTADAWQLIFNKDAHTFHTNYRQRSDFNRIMMRKEALPEDVEQLTFAIERKRGQVLAGLPDIPGSQGQIVMTWEKTKVSVPFTVR